MKISRTLFCFLFFIFSIGVLFAQSPSNDDCRNASQITIPGNGFSYGTYSSAKATLLHATKQSGESFHKSFENLGLNRKTVWYSFTIPTSRSITIELKQNDTMIAQNGAGFTVYKTQTCMPTIGDLSALTPIPKFGSSTNTCMSAGTYFVQVCANFKANDSVWINLKTGAPTPTNYDTKATAFNLGTPTNPNNLYIQTECLSIDSASELAPFLGPDFKEYNKTAWLVFKTPPTGSFINIVLALNKKSEFDTVLKVGFNLFLGNAITNPDKLVPFDTGVVEAVSAPYGYFNLSLNKSYLCDNVVPDSYYTIQLFFHQKITTSAALQVFAFAGDATKAPNPKTIPGTHKLGTIANNQAKSVTDFVSCNGSIAQNKCSATDKDYVIDSVANPQTILDTFNINSWFTFTIGQSGNITINSSYKIGTNTYSGLASNTTWRIFKGNISLNCNLPSFASAKQGRVNLFCLDPGTYSVQFLAKTTGENADYYSIPLGVSTTFTVSFKATLAQGVAKFDTPLKAEDMGDINLAPNKTKTSSTDFLDGMLDSALIDSIQLYNHSSYRQFHLSTPASIFISTLIVESNSYHYNIFKNCIFKGKATDGSQALTALDPNYGYHSFYANGNPDFESNPCVPLDTGWYTVVSTHNNFCENSTVKKSNQISVGISTPCTPKFDKPSKASLVNNGQPLTWNQTPNPRYARKYLLEKGCFSCQPDSLAKKIAPNCYYSSPLYYVFSIQDACMMTIEVQGGFSIYKVNVMKDSLLLLDSNYRVKGCGEGNRFCNMQPGTYTLLSWGDNYLASQYPATITIDRLVGPPANDFAVNAVDLGNLPGTNIPISPFDVTISCMTGAHESNPAYSYVSSSATTKYPIPPNYVEGYYTRKNVWYTFTVVGSGNVTVKTVVTTPGLNNNLMPFAIYKSAAAGSIPWPTLTQSGKIDSTIQQGLVLVASNQYYNPYFSNTATFSKSGCDSVRYFVLVDQLQNLELIQENYQIRVSASYTNINATQAGDYCNNAVAFGGNNAGTYVAGSLVNCHTIGEGFGEDGSNMGCLFNNQTHKSSWFKFTLNTTAKSDLSFSIGNQTNATADKIRYRVLWGSCNAMTPGPCVESALSSFKLDCMANGDYYIQVVTPIECTGTIRVNVAVSASSYPICKPASLFTPLANFIPVSPCGGKTVTFQNLSTSGVNVVYDWDFDNGIKSSAKSPTITFSPTQQIDTFTIRLIVTDTVNNASDTITLPVFVFQDPVTLDAGNDKTIIRGGALGVQLQAITNYPGPIFEWSPQTSLSNAYISNPYANPNSSTLYKIELKGDDCTLYDSVKVIVFTPTRLIEQTLCEGDTIELRTWHAWSSPSYLWTTGDTTETIEVSQGGTYVVVTSMEEVNQRDSFIVTKVQRPQPALVDTAFCNGLTIELDAGSGATSYLWSTGEITQKIKIISAGQYFVQYNYQGCNVSDTATVNRHLIPFKALTDTGLCSNISIMLDAGAGFDSYLWSTGETARIIEAKEPKHYSVTHSFKNCIDSSIFNVSSYPTEILFSQKDTGICGDFQIDLNAGTGSSYLWNPTAQTKPTITVSDYGVYCVTKQDANGCWVSDTFSIYNSCTVNLFVPNAFTINGDGVNDQFLVKGTNVYAFDLSIFNRWGQKIFYTTNINQGWDGTQNGRLAPADVYVWQVNYQNGRGQVFSKKGNVTLLR